MRKIIISKKLKFYRFQNSITQQQLADMLGITSQSVSKWEREECCPDIALLPVLADTIGCKVDEFFA
jgi:DNA-binding XRE family transcriptional regulator